MNNTEINLLSATVSEACHWLLDALHIENFRDSPYTIPFSAYVMTWPRSVPLTSILILQSPYPRNIFPPIAAAMSFSEDLCKKEMQEQEVPPTVKVLANDLYINANMDKKDTISILKNGWALVDKGILMVNESVFSQPNSTQAYIESVKQCSVLIKLLRETEKYGKRTVDIYAFGEPGERVGSNLCSWYKSSIVKLSKRKVTHPAGIARRFNNLDDINCHMNTPSFSKALAKCFSNHVAFMHTMAKKTAQDLRYERLDNGYFTLSNQFGEVADCAAEFAKIQKELLEMDKDDPRYKETMNKLLESTNELASRFRISVSIATSIQSHGLTAATAVSRAAPSMRTVKPSDTELSEHIGAEPITSTSIGQTPPILKQKKAISTPRHASSFSNISSPSSVKSIGSEISTPTLSSPSFKAKSKVVRRTSMLREDLTKDLASSTKEVKDMSKSVDSLSPINKTFEKKIIVPKSKKMDIKTPTSSQSTPTSPTLSSAQKKILSAIRGLVEIHRPNFYEDPDCVEALENIDNDIRYNIIYNFVTERLVAAIDQDIEENPKFSILGWLAPTDRTCNTFRVCQEEFGLSES